MRRKLSETTFREADNPLMTSGHYREGVFTTTISADNELGRLLLYTPFRVSLHAVFQDPESDIFGWTKQEMSHQHEKFVQQALTDDEYVSELTKGLPPEMAVKHPSGFKWWDE